MKGCCSVDSARHTTACYRTRRRKLPARQCQALARAVMQQALSDFGLRHGSQGKSRWHWPSIKDTRRRRYEAWAMIEAGRFLVERTDENAEFWRSLAEWRRTPPEWTKRLSHLRAIVKKLTPVKKMTYTKRDASRPGRGHARACRNASAGENSR